MKRSIRSMIMATIAAFVFAISGCKWFEKEPTQEELFEEYAAIAKTSMEEKFYYAEEELTYSDGTQSQSQVMYITTDSKGRYSRYNGNDTYYFKRGNEYIYYTEENGGEAYYASQSYYEEQTKNIIVSMDSIYPIFSAESILDIENAAKQFFITEYGLSLSELSIEIEFSKIYDDEIGKEKLVLIVGDEVEVESTKVTLKLEVNCVDGKIKKFTTEEKANGVTTTMSLYVEYFTNTSLVPDDYTLNGIVVD